MSEQAIRRRTASRQIFGSLFLFSALVIGLLLFGVITDYTTRTWTDYEVDEHRILISIAALLLVICLSSGVALMRSGNAGGRVSRLFFIGALCVSAGLVAAPVVSSLAAATLTSIEPLWTLLPFGLPVAGVVLMAIGAAQKPRTPTT